MPENILDQMKKAPATNVVVHNSDPEVIANVKEFLAAQQAGTEAESKQRDRTTIAPDPVVGAPNPDTAFVREALVPVENIAITEEEKRIYLKSLLSDDLTRFSITLYDGQLKYDLRTRSMFEQRRVLDIVNDRIAGVSPKDPTLKDNLAGQFDMMQQYFALLMVERINGVIFSELSLSPGPSLDEHYAKLSAEAERVFSKMNNVCWTAMLNAMRMFESKCARLAENAMNEDFWKPRS
jgi:hypothetical protein